jgi:hypothetical protein
VCDWVWFSASGLGCAKLRAVLRVACAWRCVCSDVSAVRRGCGCAGRPAGVRGLCVYAACECAMCGAWLVGVRCLGYTRHDADVPLWWVGLVASCVSLCARVGGVMVAGSAALVGMCAAVRVGPAKMGSIVAASCARCTMRVLGVHCRRCLERRVLCRSIAIAKLCCRVRVAAPRLVAAAV